MPALDTALPLAQVHHMSVLVSEHLEFNVSRPLDELFEVYVRNAESLLRFVSSGHKRRRQFFRATNDAHPAATTASRGFQNHWIFDSCSFGQCCGFDRNDSL